nr:hypothetical protein [Tanacetum cinerariifolium]
RLSIVHCPGYEAGESSVVAAARPIEGRRIDYRFVDYVEAEIRRRRAEDIGYGTSSDGSRRDPSASGLRAGSCRCS